MTGPLAAHAVSTDIVTETVPIRWGRPLANNEFDRRHELRVAEAEALKALSPLEMRRNRARGLPRRTAAQWTASARLLEPLDAARVVLHHVDDIRYRRAGAHAVAVVLAHCATSGRAYWGWSAWAWATVCGPSSQAFLAAQPLPTESTVRPFVMALGYLLGEFDEFQHLGDFNRLHLANLVFGAAPIEEAMSQASTVMERWGYLSQTSDDGRYRLPGVLSQALLINRSPRLQDRNTTAFAALHAHPATSGRYPASLHALQRVVADLGHCDAPVRSGYNHSPAIIGTDPTWASWVERRHDTSTLTPKVRAPPAGREDRHASRCPQEQSHLGPGKGTRPAQGVHRHDRAAGISLRPAPAVAARDEREHQRAPATVPFSMTRSPSQNPGKAWSSASFGRSPTSIMSRTSPPGPGHARVADPLRTPGKGAGEAPQVHDRLGNAGVLLRSPLAVTMRNQREHQRASSSVLLEKHGPELALTVGTRYSREGVERRPSLRRMR